MRPKKRERDVPPPPDKPHFEHISPDHELFLQAFEKPTQIYRYLRTRHIVSPIFMHRNLLYMKKRYCRPGKKKDGSSFSIDGMLEKMSKNPEIGSPMNEHKSEFMNLQFLGFYQRNIQDHKVFDRVEVQPILVKISHRKRKDVSPPYMQIELGKVEVPFNPENVSEGDAPAISISSEHFNQTNGYSGKSFVLALRVGFKGKRGLQNGHCIREGDETVEPVAKRSRSSKNVEYEDHDSHMYSAELVIYDKHKSCLLTDGDYEVVLQGVQAMSMPKESTAWEMLKDGESGSFEVFNNSPTVKFRLSWSSTPVQHEKMRVDSRLPVSDYCNNNVYDKKSNLAICEINDEAFSDLPGTPVKDTKIYYHFNYQSNTRQQTESRDDHLCPWCLLNCMEILSLLKHLRLCHARFNFTYTPDPKGARIDVTINEGFDGSYVGNPQDLHSNIGYAFSRNGPVRRTPVTYITVYRPKRSPPNLSEFLEPEEPETGRNRQIVQGHNRLYYHTVTNQPIRPNEIDQDSEEENDPEWLRQKTINLIDEFTDVNEGEKEVMKMWNLHVMHHNFIGDCQLPVACETFVEEYGPALIVKNLRKNFLLHLMNLFDFGLVRPEVVMRTIFQFDQLADSLRDSSQGN